MLMPTSVRQMPDALRSRIQVIQRSGHRTIFLESFTLSLNSTTYSDTFSMRLPIARARPLVIAQASALSYLTGVWYNDGAWYSLNKAVYTLSTLREEGLRYERIGCV